MAFYDCKCQGCPKAPTFEHDGKTVHLDAEFQINVPMSQAPEIGKKNIKCPVCKRKKAHRVFSTGVGIIIKGATVYDWKHGEAMRTNINGQDVRFTFVDHPHTDPSQQRKLADLGRQYGLTGNSTGLNNAYVDEKTGRTCVKVVSNVPDPLGKIEKQKREGNYTQVSKKVNTPVKRRSKKS